MGCGYLPHDLRARARRDGDVCCLSRDVWMAPAPKPVGKVERTVAYLTHSRPISS
jgi:hypothetical protein